MLDQNKPGHMIRMLNAATFHTLLVFAAPEPVLPLGHRAGEPRKGWTVGIKLA